MNLFKLVLVACLLSACTMVGYSQDPGLEDSQKAFEDWVGVVGEYVEGVRVEEEDFESFLEHWDDLSGIMGEEDEDEGALIDIEAIVSDAEFRSWASGKGLDPDGWFQKSMRIMVLVMRDQFLESAKRSEESYPRQLQMIEGQRAQMGEESYRQAKEALDAGVAMSTAIQSAVKKLPQATPSEEALLQKYQEELAGLLGTESEDEEEEWN